MEPFLQNLSKLTKEIAKCRRKLESSNERQMCLPLEWKSTDFLPTGWKTKLADSGNKIFLSPDGNQFAGRRVVLQHMIKEKFSESNISEMRTSMADNGWKISDCLPKNWLYKVKSKTNRNIDILSSEGQLLPSYLTANEYIKSSEAYSNDELDKFSKLSN